jgi:hypothetical protein
MRTADDERSQHSMAAGQDPDEARFRQRQLHVLTETAKNLGFTLVAAEAPTTATPATPAE